jgi:hypothetical protein
MSIDFINSKLLDRRSTKNDRILGQYIDPYQNIEDRYLRYLSAAMAEIDPKYTARLVEQGNRVENQLDKRLINVDFRRQGSVTNNTHIRAESDVDLLVITKEFVTLQRPQVVSHPYSGSVQTILKLRGECVASLNVAFPQAKVDDTGSFSIALDGGSLFCKVDVVPSNWYNSNKYAENGSEIFRGIRVLNKYTHEFSENYPFLTNFRLKIKNDEYHNKPCMCIRLLKNLKVDSNQKYDISSYDICSLVYRGSDAIFTSSSTDAFNIATQLFQWMKFHCEDDYERDRLLVIDESRKIFDNEDKVKALNQATNDLAQLLLGVMENTAVNL